MNVETATLPEGTAQPSHAVRKLLDGAEIRFQDETYRRKSDQAKRERRRLFMMMKTLNMLVLGVGVVSGLLLAVAVIRGWQVDPTHPFTRLARHTDMAEKALVVLIVLCTVFASAMGRIMREGDSLARYRKLRAEAEAARSGRFTTLARRAAEIGPAPALEALDLIRERLLEDQRAFYLRRAEEHRASLLSTGRWAGLGIILSALASMAAVTVLSTDWTQPLLVLGVIAAAISAFAVDREGLNRDRANAELYDQTAERLGGLSVGVERIRHEIEGGNSNAVVTFANLVSDELQQEHRRWVAGLDVTSQLLQQLDERLSAAKARGEGIEIEPRPRPAAVRPAETVPPAAEPVPPVATPVPPAFEPPVIVVEPAAEPAPPPVTLAEPIAPGGPVAATLPAPRQLAALLGQWSPVLVAAAAVLPAAQARRVQALLQEIGALADPLAAAQPTPDSISRAERLVTLLERGGPVSEWLAAGTDVAGLVMPPAAILLGAAGLAAELGEDAYRRWVASVLDAPVPPALVRSAAVDATVVMAALERAPIFGAVLEAERRDRNGAMLLSFVSRALSDPDALWPEVADRFDNDRGDFDAGISEIAKALLGPAASGDLAQLAGSFAGGSAQQIHALVADPKAGPVLRNAVLLMHEIRAEGGPAAADLLVAALRRGQVS